MMNYFLIILLLSASIVFSQEQNPNVELPDFVIFGKDEISVRKVDKIKKNSEELVLTTLVLVYFIFVLWVVSVDFLGFTLIKSHYALIPILVIVAIIYSLWAEKDLKKK